MGTGKTAVGKELAAKKKLQFVDLDELIEMRERRTISDIFVKDGEPCFRRIEKRILKEVAKEKGFVVACGGGIVIDKENIKIMKETGVVVCLTAAPEVILKRTSGCADRPLLNVSDTKKQIELLLKLRAPFYARADFSLDTSRLSVEEVLKEVIRFTRSQSSATMRGGSANFYGGHKVTRSYRCSSAPVARHGSQVKDKGKSKDKRLKNN